MCWINYSLDIIILTLFQGIDRHANFIYLPLGMTGLKYITNHNISRVVEKYLVHKIYLILIYYYLNF